MTTRIVRTASVKKMHHANGDGIKPARYTGHDSLAEPASLGRSAIAASIEFHEAEADVVGFRIRRQRAEAIDRQFLERAFPTTAKSHLAIDDFARRNQVGRNESRRTPIE